MATIQHECGVALVRKWKPCLDDVTSSAIDDSASVAALTDLLLQQQHRGQEAAGIAVLMPCGFRRYRASGRGALMRVIQHFQHVRVHANLWMGHVRYATAALRGVEYAHPLIRRASKSERSLCLCGNFNITNAAELRTSDKDITDTQILLRRLSHALDASEYSFARLPEILRTVTQYLDGGYVICGALENGDAFVMRDPWGIRTAYYYRGNDVLAVASERAALMHAFDVDSEDVTELKPGAALLSTAAGQVAIETILPSEMTRSCVFERIYFASAADPAICQERTALGAELADALLHMSELDPQTTVLTYVPTTAGTAFEGLCEAVRVQTGRAWRCLPLIEKQQPVRTFIAHHEARPALVQSAYRVRWEMLPEDTRTLVVIDDSIVRGTTMRDALLPMLCGSFAEGQQVVNQLVRVVILSSAPQVRYPDFYGIDIADLSQLVAFRSMVAEVRSRGNQSLLDETYRLCMEQRERLRAQLLLPLAERAPLASFINPIRRLYDVLTDEEMTAAILAELLRDISDKACHGISHSVVFQSVAALRAICPNHTGDWYFTGDYPTLGGLYRLMVSYMQFYESAIGDGRPETPA